MVEIESMCTVMAAMISKTLIAVTTRPDEEMKHEELAI